MTDQTPTGGVAAPARPELDLPASTTGIPTPRQPSDQHGFPILVIERGQQAGARFAIRTPCAVIGRDRDCDIVLDDVTVSRYHVEVRREGDHYVLEDCGSLNGTFLNRSPVESAVLADGDEIRVGDARLTFAHRRRVTVGRGTAHPLDD
ncbi:hypothetical protein GCM10011581_27860 [Saccharopolyspora subtropica]|uniref:FHA domain-containing protein n=1 Tax=Saccharopolyspora thermophila TaxID=89367 RepID=A0A917JVQ5_9PSEU|nr:FHA domain-containing protein [Saccharopolyspora subtropica]GGI89180.1 hypothetical protein GCM10011581_27860 [Saccharopolyspora subtropica]